MPWSKRSLRTNAILAAAPPRTCEARDVDAGRRHGSTLGNRMKRKGDIFKRSRRVKSGHSRHAALRHAESMKMGPAGSGGPPEQAAPATTGGPTGRTFKAALHGPVGHPETMKIAVLAHLSGIDRGTAASHRYSPTERHTTKSSGQLFMALWATRKRRRLLCWPICQGSTEGRQRATGTRLQKGTRPNLRGRLEGKDV